MWHELEPQSVRLGFQRTLAAVFLLRRADGYQPPAHLSLDPSTWRRGICADHVIVRQVALGLGLLMVGVVVGVRLNRHIATEQPAKERRDSNRPTPGCALRAWQCGECGLVKGPSMAQATWNEAG